MNHHDKLTKDNYLLYAAKFYDNPEGTGMSDFKEDLARLVYIKRLMSRHFNGKELKLRLLLNHIIIFYNVFGIDAATRLLFFGLDTKYHGILKTFLVFMNYIDEETFNHKYNSGVDIHKIDIDQKILKDLNEL